MLMSIFHGQNVSYGIGLSWQKGYLTALWLLFTVSRHNLAWSNCTQRSYLLNVFSNTSSVLPT